MFLIPGKEIIVNVISSPIDGEKEKKLVLTPKLLLDLLAIGSVDLELWGESELAKLVGVGTQAEEYALAKVWNPEIRREVIDLVAISDIRGVKLSV